MRDMTHRSSTRLAPGWLLGICGSIASHASSDNQNSPSRISRDPSPQVNQETRCESKYRLGLDPKTPFEGGGNFSGRTAAPDVPGRHRVVENVIQRALILISYGTAKGMGFEKWRHKQIA